MNTKERELRDKLRHLAQTDLFWLATEILGYNLVEDVHEPITDFFIKKNPDLPLLYGQSDVRNRLLLYPRGHYKTTIDIADCVQWALAFPNVRVSINSGTIEMGAAILKVVKHHFLYNEKLLKLFPEYRLDPREAGTQFAFTVPARTDRSKKEPTFSVSTARSTKSGWHYDVMKFDDMVNDQNYNKPELLAKTIDQYKDISPLVDPGGYRDVVGTPYSYNDMYSWIQDNRKQFKYKVLKRPAATLPFGPESTILFPFDRSGEKKFDYEYLKEKQDEDEYKFNCQYLLDPTPSETSVFNEELILTRTVSEGRLRMVRPTLESNLQRVGRVYIVWDLAPTDTPTADYSAGVVGWFDTDGTLYIIDLVLGKFNPHELVLQIILLARKWQYFLVKVGFDESMGARYLEAGLSNYMAMYDFWFPIDYLKIPRKKDRKTKDILSLHAPIKQGKIRFKAGLPYYDDLVKQFIRFGGGEKDDIPDAIAMLYNEYRSNIETYMYRYDHVLDMSVKASAGSEVLGAGIVG